MNNARWLLLLAAAPLLAFVPSLPACRPCIHQTDIDILSDTTEGTFAFSGADTRSIGHGSVSYTDGTASVQAQSQTSILITLSVGENSDTVTITIPTDNLNAGPTIALPAGSTACLDTVCATLEGTFTAQSLAIDCSNGPALCALTLEGQLQATATFTSPPTTATLNLALAHQDEAQTYCEQQGGE